jgi:hypothetical protein
MKALVGGWLGGGKDGCTGPAVCREGDDDCCGELAGWWWSRWRWKVEVVVALE